MTHMTETYVVLLDIVKNDYCTAIEGVCVN